MQTLLPLKRSTLGLSLFDILRVYRSKKKRNKIRRPPKSLVAPVRLWIGDFFFLFTYKTFTSENKYFFFSIFLLCELVPTWLFAEVEFYFVFFSFIYNFNF